MHTDIATLHQHVLACAGSSSSAKCSSNSTTAKRSRPSGLIEQTALQDLYVLGKLEIRAGMHKSNQLFLSILSCSAMLAFLLGRHRTQALALFWNVLAVGSQSAQSNAEASVVFIFSA